MLFIVNKIFPTVIGCLILLSLADKSVQAEENSNLSDTTCISETDDSKGYSDIVLFRNKLIAVGTDGRIDCISKSGEKVPLEYSSSIKYNCAFSNDEILIAAGDNGTILYSSDGENFYRAETGINKNINGITSKNGLIIAGADSGIILTSTNGKSWNIIPTEVKGNIISLSANNSFFIGITDAGEIIKSFDGNKWEINDYNKEYAGYNRYAKFKKILAAHNSIVTIGTHDDGSPSILFSSLGNVWAERIPVYNDDQGMDCYLTKEPNDITYNPDRDEFILACDGGELLSLPSCNKCNEYNKISENDLHSLIYVDNYLLISDDEFSVFIQSGN
jgi:hypothetical protein